MLNPSGEVPVLVGQSPAIPICGHYPIAEYLEETYTTPSALGESASLRAETRRLMAWFDENFYHDVHRNIAFEKMEKHFYSVENGGGPPDTYLVRLGRKNMEYHLRYIEFLMKMRHWLAGSNYTLADMTAAAHLSCVDYLGEINWARYPKAREWYARVKSRPAFKPLLHEVFPGIAAARNYASPDF